MSSAVEELEQESQLVSRELPPAVWRNLGWLITVLVGAALLGAVVVKLPETVDSRFVLTPVAGADPVESPVAGTIEEIAVSDGSEVREGDLLFTVRSEEIAVLLERVSALESQVASLEAVGTALEQRHEASRIAARSRVSRLKAELPAARRRHLAAKRRLAIAEASYAERLISETEVLDAREVAAESEQIFERLSGELEEARSQQAAVGLSQQQELAERALELAKLKGELETSKAALRAEARGEGMASRDLYEVRAPYDGMVISLGPRRKGVVIERRDLLCSVARADAKLVAELSVPELGSGRVEPGQRVTLLFDAFPHIRYGTRTATVSWISPTALEGRMRARASLVDTSMVVGGNEKPLRAGMVGEAHVLVGWRTLAELALEPLQALRENLQAGRH